MSETNSPRDSSLHEDFSYNFIADRMIEIAVEDDRIRAIWIEADEQKLVRRPYDRLEVHYAADEPLHPAIVGELEELLSKKLRVENRGVTDTERLAKQFDLEIGSLDGDGDRLDVTVIVEQSCYLAKRPRAWVVPLLDKTNHLCHVMDFSRRR